MNDKLPGTFSQKNVKDSENEIFYKISVGMMPIKEVNSSRYIRIAHGI